MVLKKKLFLPVMLVLLVGSIVLSLKHSKRADHPDGEIKHLAHTIRPEQLRIQNGLSVEEFIDRHILLGDRIKKHTVAATAVPPSAPATSQTAPSAQTASAPQAASPSQDAPVPQSLPAVKGSPVPSASSTSPASSDRATQPVETILDPEEPPTTQPTYQPGVELKHKVTWGETLASLAQRYRTTPYQIAQRNGLSEEAILTLGQTIRIVPEEPSTYRVRRGDTLMAIAHRFGVQRAEIERLNHLDAHRPIWVGQKLILPTEQKKIDTILAQIDEQARQEAERKRRYQHQLFSRIEEQKRLRRIAAAKAKAEQKARQAREKARQAQEAARAKARAAKSTGGRLARAKRVFKVSGSSRFKHKLRVVATAYTSHRSQTDSTPFLAAWNNRIRPGMKIIAVSPDLIRKYGITNGVRVKIGGLPGTYVVRDKMNPRLHNHIDIYMGTNRRRALRWGRRRVMLYW